MCNHYRMAILKGATIPGWSIDQFSEIRIPIRFDNMPTDIYPDREGLVVREAAGVDGAPEPVVEAMRWGFPPPKKTEGKTAPYVTNVRNVASPYWRPWLKPEHRCLVPATAFSEYGPTTPKREYWFARADGEPFYFAGIWRDWAGDRGPKSKPVPGPHRIFSFLTCAPNNVVAPIHSKAMPVILKPEDCATWLRAPVEIALQLQRPLPEADLVVVEG
jgi:putative SOS response-associated peptidase YedK